MVGRKMKKGGYVWDRQEEKGRSTYKKIKNYNNNNNNK